MATKKIQDVDLSSHRAAAYAVRRRTMFSLLCELADETGMVTISRNGLRARVHMSDSTVAKVIDQLKESGHILEEITLPPPGIGTFALDLSKVEKPSAAAATAPEQAYKPPPWFPAARERLARFDPLLREGFNG